MKRLFRLPFSRDRVHRDVNTELSFHLEGRIAELVARGMSREDAEREAAQRFGNRERVEAEMERIDYSTHRRREVRERFDGVRRNALFALRQFRRSPGFTFVVLLTLSLGIGATTAIYTVLDSVVLRPLPYAGADRLVSVLHPATVPGNGESKWGMSAGGYFTFKDGEPVVRGPRRIPHRRASSLFDGPRTPSWRKTGEITASIFSTLRAARRARPPHRPCRGQARRAPVVVLSYEFWQRRFGGDRNISASMLQTSDGPEEIIGVTERGLSLPKPGPFASTCRSAGFRVDVWTPLRLNPNGPFYNSHQYSGIGRLKPGVSPEAAQRDLAAIMREFHRQDAAAYSDRFMQVIQFPRRRARRCATKCWARSSPRALWLLFGSVALVLCIACANVANLFLVRMETAAP